ncbi:MAG: hypothetical protein HY325_04925 [Chloroflexi bacterium]|nr:hypothetical protein [Chloroflexota bacterium]
MGKGNNMYEEMDRINRRIRELGEKDSIGWYDQGDVIRESTLTEEEKQERDRLCSRLEELKNEDDKSQGLI